MPTKLFNSNWKNALVYWAICLLYIVLYMPYGFEGTDTGYIFGTSWNIYNGQLPHRDFVYTRPAIPAYFHTIFIYISETYGYLLDRSFFYVQVFLYSFLGAKLLAEHFAINNRNTLYFIALLGAIISIHNYPPMGWNTIDGIFFCMIGMYFLLLKNTKIVHLLLGSVCVVLGVFSKQSFYFMPIFIFGYLLFTKNYYRLKFYTLFGGLAVLGYISFKYFTGTLLPFWEQTFVRTSSSALVNAGIKTYYLALKFNVLFILVILAVLWLSLKYTSKNISFTLLHCIIAGFIIAFFIERWDSWKTIPYVFQIWWMASVAFCVISLRKDRRYLLLLLLLSLSWSASISNGYRTPIHFSLPVVFASYIFFTNEKKKFSKWLYVGIAFVYLVTFMVGYQTLYRDSQRKELTYAMGDVYPQLTFIKSDQETFEKYQELKSLSDKHPNFTVIPAATHAHYLTGTVNPMGTDWPHDIEINLEPEPLLDKLKEKNSAVFIETTEYSEKEIADYEIKKIVEETWTLIEQGKHFKIYAPN